MKFVIIFGAIMVLAAAGAFFQGGPGSGADAGQEAPKDKSELIFDAVKKKGVQVERSLVSNGTEIKKAMEIEDLGIDDNSTVSFLIIRYSNQEGIDIKLLSVITAIYTTLAVEPSIDGVFVMPYDPFVRESKVNLIYTNRSYSEKVASQKLPLRKFFNSFDVYTITRDLNAGE